MLQLLLLTSWMITSTLSFSIPHPLAHRRRLSSALSSSIQERYFQLEELEDASSATTEIFLNADHTLSIGETDGPLFLKATGTWQQQADQFLMSLTRTYQGGTEKREVTSMGEFPFQVVRTFVGDVTSVGDLVSVSGKITSNDDVMGEKNVGYFHLIDTTNDRLGEEP